MTDQPKDYAGPADRLAGQDWSGVAKTGLSSMAPADKGWVLAVVVIIAILQASDYFQTVNSNDSYSKSMIRMTEFLDLIEQDRRQDQLARTAERKELIRIVENLTQTVTRQANRDGRAETANQAVSNALKAQGDGS